MDVFEAATDASSGRLLQPPVVDGACDWLAVLIIKKPDGLLLGRSLSAALIYAESDMNQPFRRSRLGNPYQFDDAAGDVPVLDIEVPLGIPIRSMGTAEDSLHPFHLRDIEI